MRAFADLLETTTAAASTTTARNLTTMAAVKLALKISNTASDALIDSLIPRATRLIEDDCRLALDVAGSVPTFGRETLRATWNIERCGLYGGSDYSRGVDLFLPWRLPVYSIDSVVENGVTLTTSTDYVLLSAKAGRLRRMASDTPRDWSTAKIVVAFKAGFSLTTSLAANIDAAIEAAAIEQIKGMLFGANRDPYIRSENVPDVAAISYSVPGGDVMGANVLLPSVRDMLTPWRNPSR
jgi:hypothetical protein